MDLDFSHLYFRGRVALYALLRGLGIGPGSTVAAQAYTCAAVPEAIMMTGARIKWIDIEPLGVNMDSRSLADRIDGSVNAVVVQHTFGIPADMKVIGEVLGPSSIPIIEDCCHAIGSRLNGTMLGTTGVGSFYSFEYGKPITVGLGGATRINDALLRESVGRDLHGLEQPGKLRAAKILISSLGHALCYRPRTYWQVRDAYKILQRSSVADHTYVDPSVGGSNAADFSLEMSDVQEAMLNVRLRRIDDHVLRSRYVTHGYRSQLDGAYTSPASPEGSDTVYSRYPVFVTDKQAILKRAERARVEVSGWYETPVHPLGLDESSALGYRAGCCPNAERTTRSLVTLPISKVRQRDIDRAADFLLSAVS